LTSLAQVREKEAVPKKRDEIFARPPIERIMKIRRLVENKEYPNSRQFSDELGVSVRTVKRDIEFARKVVSEVVRDE